MNPLLYALVADTFKQYGKGRGSLMPYYSSNVMFQRGRGLGSLLRKLYRPIRRLLQKPIVKKGISTLARAGATALVDAGKASLENEDVKFTQALKDASQQQAQAILKQVQGAVRGSGRRYPLKKRQRSVSHSKTVVRKRRRQGDIFA